MGTLTMGASSALRALVVVALLLGHARRSDALEFERDRTLAMEALVSALVDLGAWCEKAKLFAAREASYRDVLRFDADHAGAHAALGHKRDDEGHWREPEKRREPRDHDLEAQKEYRERRAQAIGAYRDALLLALERERAELAPARVDAVREELLLLAPDDVRTRAFFGEQRSGEAWVLDETVLAREQRAALKDMVRAGYEGQPEPRAVPASEREAALGLTFAAVLETPVARVLGTGDPTEAQAVARALQAGRAFFNGALGTNASYYPGASVFVLARSGDKEVLLDHHPATQGAYGEFLAGLEGSGLQGSHDMAHWGKDEKQRLDGITRIGISWLLYDAFGITSDQAWIYEGFGLYMTRELVGTRLTWFAKPSEYMRPREEAALRLRLLLPGTNWMEEASKVLAGEHAPQLAFVVGKTVNSMSPEDMLYSYVLAAYLLEARPADAPLLLQKVGSGALSVKALEEVLGLNVKQIDLRVKRWLSERH